MATSTPRLWSQIAITESLHSQSEFVHTLALWLYRSGDCGFSFTLSNCPAELHENNHTFDAIMDVLLDNCGVWRDVHLNVRQKHMVKLLSAIPSRTPKIRKLAIWGVGDRRAISGTRLFSVPLISLTHLSIVHVATLFSSRSDGLLMENLRSLHLRLADQSDLIECLSRSPRLEELSARFEFSTQKLQPIHDHVNVCLAHLHYLDLSLDVHTWDQGRRGPFEHFDFPALKTLRRKPQPPPLGPLHRLRLLLQDLFAKLGDKWAFQYGISVFLESPPESNPSGSPH
ncbi:hypothetical protein BD410DRAFT_832162 [Rickenella mellea]|uniref:F-box domain-containing protein n=1 Tax=Rickenella mellea TaxID=50990 RepID=A0A4Y7PMR5_9AGAM|nr:hypothetical protein BD410DRAFT_832162 [Rickenella mellea]